MAGSRGQRDRGRILVRRGRDGLAGSRGHGTRAGLCSRGEGWVGGWGRIWGFARTTGEGAFLFAGAGFRREGRDGLAGMGEGWTGGHGRGGMGWRVREDTGGGGSPHACSRGEGDGLADAQGHGRGRGWVGGFARTREGEDPRMRVREGRGMGWRMRKDTGGGGDGLAGSRGHGRGGVGVCEGRLLARTTVSVTTEPVSRKMGPRMREDTEGARSCSRGEGWVSACARTTAAGWEGFAPPS